MLVILLSWFYIFIVALTVGVTIKQLLKLDDLNVIITLFFGLFGISIFTGFWAIFLPINEIYQVIQILIVCLLFYYNKPLILIALTDLKQQFKTFSIFFKSSLILVFILALAQCASPPFLIDNESYYIQTIKWLNEYGFVKGLTNLHVFLGQTSGWHILQSAFNFSFIYDSLNDISGFCLLLGNFYAMSKLNLYIKSKKKNALDLIIGLFPLFNVFFFQFISVPSADIAIYVITLIVFHQFTTCFLVYKKSTFITLALLTIFASFIKLTGVFLFLFTIIIYLKYYIEAKKLTLLISGFGAITLSLFIIKNLILTGTILYPLHGIIETSWSLPETITEYISNYSKASTYNLTIDNYNTASKIDLFKHWLLLPKLDGIINKLMLLILLIFPLVILKSKYKKAFFFIYSITIINLIIIFNFSPQYRFFFPFLMVLLLITSAQILKSHKLMYLIQTGALVLICVPLLYPINNSNLTNTTYHTESSTFRFSYTFFPYKNTKYSSKYETVTVGNLKLNAPTEIDFFWGTGNIPLPALKEEQLDYFSTYFNTIPQLRGETLKEGFYSKNLLND